MKVLLAVLLSSSCTMALAAEDRSSGTYWKSLCDQPEYDYACAYYITGLADGLTLAVTDSSLVSRGRASKVYGYCPPSTVTVGDMKQAFKKYLNDNPDKRQYRAASLALDAWRRAWPCPE